MNDAPHRLLAIISFGFGSTAAYNWLVSHGPMLITYAGGICAIVAAGFSIQASRATTKLRKIQQRKLEDDE